MKKGSSFLQGALILTVGGMVVKVIGSLNWIFLSRVLGGEGIGLYQMAFPIYLMALSLSTAGIPVAISITTAEKVALGDYRGAKRVFYLALSLLTISGLVLSALVYFGAGWLIEYQIIRDARAYPAILALSPAIFIVTILASFRGYLQGWQQMTPTAVSQIVEQLFRVGAMLILAALFLPQGLEYAAGGASMGAGVGAAAGLIVLIYYYFKLEGDVRVSAQQCELPLESKSRLIRRMIRLALPVSLSSLMLPLVANLDLFIVPVRLEVAGFTVEQATELFGYLTGMAVPLMNLATIITAALATSLVPAMAEAQATGNNELKGQRIAAAIRLTNLVTIPAAVGLWILATPVSSVVYHAPEAGGVVRVIAVGVYLLGLHQVTTGVLQGMGHTTLPVINMALAAVVKVILNWQLTAIPSLGILGAGWATNADIGVAVILNLWFVGRYAKVKWDIAALGKNVLAAAVMGVGIVGLQLILTDQGISDNLVTLLIVILLASVIYGIVLLLLGGLKEQDLKRIPVIGTHLSGLIIRLRLLKS